jgi:hypothetical protein
LTSSIFASCSIDASDSRKTRLRALILNPPSLAGGVEVGGRGVGVAGRRGGRGTEFGSGVVGREGLGGGGERNGRKGSFGLSSGVSNGGGEVGRSLVGAVGEGEGVMLGCNVTTFVEGGRINIKSWFISVLRLGKYIWRRRQANT